MPASSTVDCDAGGLKLFESGAILCYLAETRDPTHSLLPQGAGPRAEVLQWLFFQTVGVKWVVAMGGRQKDGRWVALSGRQRDSWWLGGGRQGRRGQAMRWNKRPGGAASPLAADTAIQLVAAARTSVRPWGALPVRSWSPGFLRPCDPIPRPPLPARLLRSPPYTRRPPPWRRRCCWAPPPPENRLRRG